MQQYAIVNNETNLIENMIILADQTQLPEPPLERDRPVLPERPTPPQMPAPIADKADKKTKLLHAQAVDVYKSAMATYTRDETLYNAVVAAHPERVREFHDKVVAANAQRFAAPEGYRLVRVADDSGVTIGHLSPDSE